VATTPARDNARVRMPTVFGISPGPRGDAEGRPYSFEDATRVTASVSFLTDGASLARLLPAKFELVGEPVVTVEWTALNCLQWLAGRGYNMLGVKYNARFVGEQEQAEGPFLAVLWENRADPIITGREELGFAKLYAELPEPRTLGGDLHCVAAWDQHVFMRLTVSDLIDAPPPAATSPVDGTLHHRYVPRVSSPGAHDVSETVLTPAGGFAHHIEKFQCGRGSVEFVRSTWEQLPTLHHIVNQLADLPQLESRGATWSRGRGAKDLSDQRVLR
jgi:hypothetical protein